MSANRPNISTWSTTDIQKYLNGELSAREMHDLEKAALDDPFLADALEGMEGNATAFARDLADLHTRLETRIAQKEKTPTLPFFRSGWKIAAALILLLGLGLTAYYTLLKQEHAAAPLARTTATEPLSAAPPAPTTKTNASTDSAAATTPSGKVMTGEASRNLTKAKFAGKLVDTVRIITNIARVQNGVAKTWVRDSIAIASPDRSVTPGMSVTTTTRNEAFGNVSNRNMQYEKKALTTQNFFSGKVVNANNNAPLSGVSLHLVGRNIATVTDKNGFFSLSLPEKDSVANLNVASIGYQQANLSLSQENRTGNLIQLQPQTSALDEVVVIGYGTKRKETLRSDTAEHEDREMAIQKDMESLKAVPVMGWDDYNHYLDAHKPTTGLDSTLKGEETIVFRVHSKGILSDFHIERSLSPAHDAAVIRLVQQGPAWKLNGRKKAWARVTVPF